MPLPAPDPTVLHSIAGQRRVVFLRPLVQSANVEIGEYTYYDSESAPSRGDTVVDHDVWLGYSALVLPGVTIGHGAVIAAGSVVARDVPPRAVVAGNPARVVRSPFSEEDVERLLRAARWNWPMELVTDHARTIMTGTAAELDRIATEHGLRER